MAGQKKYVSKKVEGETTTEVFLSSTSSEPAIKSLLSPPPSHLHAHALPMLSCLPSSSLHECMSQDMQRDHALSFDSPISLVWLTSDPQGTCLSLPLPRQSWDYKLNLHTRHF